MKNNCRECRGSGAVLYGDETCPTCKGTGGVEASQNPDIVEAPPGPDWRILKIEDHGPGMFYRFAILIENLNYREGSRDRFCNWRVRDIQDPRYAPHPDVPVDMRRAIEAAKEVKPK